MPAFHHGVLAAAVEPLALVQVVQQFSNLFLPLGPGMGLQCLRPFQAQARHLVDGLTHVVWRGAQAVRVIDQVAHGLAQVGRGFPVAQGLVHQRRRQWVYEGAPVIPGGVIQQFTLVGFQGEFEQTAAVKGVLAEHAVAEAVNGGHRRFVHPFGGQQQLLAAVWPRGRVRVAFIPKLVNQCRFGWRIGLVGGTGKHLGGLGQPGADAVSQLFGRSLGEGNHQQVGRKQILQWAVFGLAMAQNQAHIQNGDGKGFAGTGTGFDQGAAVQRQGKGVQTTAKGVVAHFGKDTPYQGSAAR